MKFEDLKRVREKYKRMGKHPLAQYHVDINDGVMLYVDDIEFTIDHIAFKYAGKNVGAVFTDKIDRIKITAIIPNKEESTSIVYGDFNEQNR